jgi:hypothetical protein
MKLLYYLPAFGKGNIDTKYNILLHNLEHLHNTTNESFDICINFYTICEDVKAKVTSLPFINNLYVYEKEGVLTELFLTNPNNEYISSYDYMLFILDDVQLIDFDIKKMIEVKEKYNIEILSPKIINSTYTFMYENTDLTINNFLEVYLLLMKPNDFTRFCSMHTIENKWMWGADFLFGHYKIKTGILNNYVANHVLPSESNREEAYQNMCEYFSNHVNKYISLDDIRKDFQEIVEVIDTSCLI